MQRTCTKDLLYYLFGSECCVDLYLWILKEDLSKKPVQHFLTGIRKFWWPLIGWFHSLPFSSSAHRPSSFTLVRSGTLLEDQWKQRQRSVTSTSTIRLRKNRRCHCLTHNSKSHNGMADPKMAYGMGVLLDQGEQHLMVLLNHTPQVSLIFKSLMVGQKKKSDILWENGTAVSYFGLWICFPCKCAFYFEGIWVNNYYKSQLEATLSSNILFLKGGWRGMSPTLYLGTFMFSVTVFKKEQEK